MEVRSMRMRFAALLIWIPFLALLGGCALGVVPTPRPTATLVSTVAPPTATVIPPAALAGSELLGAPGVQAACDAPPEAVLTCTEPATRPLLEVQAPASSYARWRLYWDAAQSALTGDETLLLEMERTSTLAPNLYLVARDGTRTGVSLAGFWQEGASAVAVPLREVHGEDEVLPDFAQINEIQIVFEWADMEGTLALHSVRFVPVWEEPVTLGDDARDQAAKVQAPEGFTVTPIAAGLASITQIDFTPAGEMLVSLQNGRIWWYADHDGDGRYDTRRLYATGFTEVVGLLYEPRGGAVWVGGRGRLVRTLDADGNGAADLREVRLEGLPWGRHQNNGLAWNPMPDPFTGEAGGTWLYFGLGSTGDLDAGGALNATILRFPRTGQTSADLQVVSRGNRNTYALVWAQVPVDLAQPDGERAWQLFASENGPDFNDAPDEVNHIRWGHDYGFPDQFGPVAEPAAEGAPYSGPVYAVTPHASADGIAYVSNQGWPAEYRTLYVALFGEVFSPAPVGHIVERVALHSETTPGGELTYRGEPSTFLSGLDRPLPLTTDPGGDLIVGDYATGVIYRVDYTGE
jgi:glucose/arabinose dehydrogenase